MGQDPGPLTTFDLLSHKIQISTKNSQKATEATTAAMSQEATLTANSTLEGDSV